VCTLFFVIFFPATLLLGFVNDLSSLFGAPLRRRKYTLKKTNPTENYNLIGITNERKQVKIEEIDPSF
jgi:hypothetical protein